MTKSKKTFLKTLFCAIATLGLLPSVCGIKAKSGKVEVAATALPSINFIVENKYGNMPSVTVDDPSVLSDISLSFYYQKDSANYTSKLVEGSYTVGISVESTVLDLSDTTYTVNGATTSDPGDFQGSTYLFLSYIFDITPTIEDVLPKDFPTDSSEAWVTEEGNEVYVSSGNLHFVADGSTYDLSLEKQAVIDKANSWYKATDDTIAVYLCMDEGDLVSIEFEGDSASLYEDFEGTYKAEPVLISTLLPSDFPDYTGGPWTNEIAVAQTYTFSGELKFVNGSSNTSVSLSAYANKAGENYVYKSEGNCKLKFVMESGKLSNIEFTDLSSENPTLGGSYSLSIGTILPYDLPKDCDPEDGWSAGVDKYCYISTYLSGYYLTFDNNDGYILRVVSTKKHPTLSGGNYVYTESTKTVTFNMVNGVLSSITYVDTNYDIFNGTYVSNQALVTFVAGEHGTVDLSSLRTALETTYSMTDGVLTIGEKTVTATPEEGYVFDKWTIDGQKVTSGTVSADVTITAAFKKQNSGAKFFLNIFYIYGFTLSVKDDQSILDWVFALENLGNGKVIFDFTINDIIDGIGDLIDDVKDLIVDVQEFAEKLSYEIDDLFVSFLEDASPYASVAAFALGGVYFGGLLMSTVASFIF